MKAGHFPPEAGGDKGLKYYKELFVRPILIIDPQCEIRNPDIRFHGDPIYVLYNGHNHYDGIIKRTDKVKLTRRLL